MEKLPNGVWTPWAALLCPTCHNICKTRQRKPFCLLTEVERPGDHYKKVGCDKCGAPCWFYDDIALPKLVIQLVASWQPLSGSITGAMWQTGGMCAAAAFRCEGDSRLVVVSALDDDICIGVYADNNAWDDGECDESYSFALTDERWAARKVLSIMSEPPVSKRIEDACEAADIAFWDAVARCFPEAETGDISPDEVGVFAVAAEKAIKGWVNTNLAKPCEKCGCVLDAADYCGNDRADGTSEYLCPDCYDPDAPRPCEDCERPVAYCNKCERWEHINGETCFLDGPACEGGPYPLNTEGE